MAKAITLTPNRSFGDKQYFYSTIQRDPDNQGKWFIRRAPRGGTSVRRDESDVTTMGEDRIINLILEGLERNRPRSTRNLARETSKRIQNPGKVRGIFFRQEFYQGARA